MAESDCRSVVEHLTIIWRRLQQPEAWKTLHVGTAQFGVLRCCPGRFQSEVAVGIAPVAVNVMLQAPALSCLELFPCCSDIPLPRHEESHELVVRRISAWSRD
eukprot:CAMPEP_0197714216 /NCGR_PEP_ID=MMETSP1338-20131121/130850_1 /TAXON_ID=43686 ORGANISM="Pelagodinium beii, Strain RCC1491" /NCGR_SAMPLE_ID=MMETSP1338 /ASSEMBLY_ACC=CAM_ASM_000754 /LENGTH=102 /DNA_ID=CAMNT_0043298161 /DNA_START=713 /DNA_END=1021 /DNA_ORIENTATION=-